MEAMEVRVLLGGVFKKKPSNTTQKVLEGKQEQPLGKHRQARCRIQTSHTTRKDRT